MHGSQNVYIQKSEVEHRASLISVGFILCRSTFWAVWMLAAFVWMRKRGVLRDVKLSGEDMTFHRSSFWKVWKIQKWPWVKFAKKCWSAEKMFTSCLYFISIIHICHIKDGKSWCFFYLKTWTFSSLGGKKHDLNGFFGNSDHQGKHHCDLNKEHVEFI